MELAPTPRQSLRRERGSLGGRLVHPHDFSQDVSDDRVGLGLSWCFLN